MSSSGRTDHPLLLKFASKLGIINLGVNVAETIYINIHQKAYRWVAGRT